MDYTLTKHAIEAIEKRKINLNWLKKAFSSPEWTEQDSIDDVLEHGLSRIQEFGGRILRVIVNTSVSPPKIITVYFDRKRTKDEIENR